MKNVNLSLITATDRLGRKLPRAEEAPARRANRYVGMFYFICNSQEGTDGPYDVEKIIAQDPTAAMDENHPLWGPIDGAAHFWGEPLFGYYFSRDEWVIRKHVEMLAYADIDFIVFDTTNRAIFFDTTTRIMRILDEYIRAGYKVPQIVYMTNTQSGETVNEIYERIYAKNLYPDTWFHWDGKPLIIGDYDESCAGAQEFFTFRANQWPFEEQKPGGFPWMEFIRPQRVYRREDGTAEVINVSVAQHPNCAHSDAAFFGARDAWGRSWHNGAPDTRLGAVNWGFNVQEQWDYALAKDPEIVFITGWNEWTAGRWSWDRTQPFGYEVTNAEEGITVRYDRPSRPQIRHTFCDCATEEYSRDIEPMKGGYFDNYYIQLIDNVRRFKGMDPAPVDTGDGIEYPEYPFGDAHRACRGFGKYVYKEDSGLNGIRSLKVRADGVMKEIGWKESGIPGSLVFEAACAAPIVRRGNWMRLFIADGTPGYLGYRWMVTGDEDSDEFAALWEYKNGAFERVKTVGMELCGDTVRYIIPRKFLGFAEGPVELRFQWADGIALDGTVDDLYLHGDTAPYGRLSYLYRTE